MAGAHGLGGPLTAARRRTGGPARAAPAGRRARDQALVGERLEDGSGRLVTASAASSVAAPGEDAERDEGVALAARAGRSSSPASRAACAGARARRAGPGRAASARHQPSGEAGGVEHADPRRRELDRQREPAEAAADPRPPGRSGSVTANAARRRAALEQPDRPRRRAARPGNGARRAARAAGGSWPARSRGAQQPRDDASAPGRCSRLSSTSSGAAGERALERLLGALAGTRAISSASQIAGAICSASPTEASETKRPSTVRAISSASRVLPTPPGPVSVSRRRPGAQQRDDPAQVVVAAERRCRRAGERRGAARDLVRGSPARARAAPGRARGRAPRPGGCAGRGRSRARRPGDRAGRARASAGRAAARAADARRPAPPARRRSARVAAREVGLDTLLERLKSQLSSRRSRAARRPRSRAPPAPGRARGRAPAGARRRLGAGPAAARAPLVAGRSAPRRAHPPRRQPVAAGLGPQPVGDRAEVAPGARDLAWSALAAPGRTCPTAPRSASRR